MRTHARPSMVATLTLILALGGCTLKTAPPPEETATAEDQTTVVASEEETTTTKAPPKVEEASDEGKEQDSDDADESSPVEGAPTFTTRSGVLVDVDVAGARTVVVPDGVTEIGDGAFADEKTLEYVLIPEGVTRIGSGAFQECTNLKHVNLPSTLTSIGENAFFYCVSLENIALPEGLASIGAGAFYHADSLQKLTFGPELTEIGDYAFSHSGLIGLDLTDSTKLTTIERDLCADCTGLGVVELPEGVSTLEAGAFRNSGIAHVSLPSSLTKIGDQCFQKCRQLTEIEVAAETIGRGAFAYAGLAKVAIKESVASLGAGAFVGCPVASFAVDEANTHYQDTDGVLLTADGATLMSYPIGDGSTSYSVPAGVTTIAEGAFALADLGRVTLPEGLDAIGANAFRRSLITSLAIPDSVTHIGESAFEDCAFLETVSLGEGVEELPKNALAYCHSLKTLDFTDALRTIHPSALLGASALGEDYEGTGLDASPNFAVVDGLLLSEDKTTLIAYPNMFAMNKWGNYLAQLEAAQANTGSDGMVDEEEARIEADEPDRRGEVADVADEREADDGKRQERVGAARSEATEARLYEYTLPTGITAIAEDAFSCAPIQVLHLTGTMDEMGERAFGYNASGSALRVRAIVDEAGSPVVRDYATTNEIAYFWGPIDTQPRELNLTVGETKTFEVDHIKEQPIIYSSDKPEVAIVNEQGTITAVGAGQVSIVATVCGIDFSCRVTVTGEAAKADDATAGFEAVLTEADRGLSTAEVEELAYPWLKDYLRNNPDVAFEQSAYPAINQYTGDDYTQVKSQILGPLSDYYKNTAASEGAVGEQFATVADDLEGELTDVARVHTGTITYSGTNDVTMFTHASNSLEDMVASIGTIIETNNVISTSLTPDIAHDHTGDSPAATILEFYIPEGFDDGIYLDTFSVYEGELELLLNKGIRLKVLDAGVREVTDAGAAAPHTERYLKLLAFAE